MQANADYAPAEYASQGVVNVTMQVMKRGWSTNEVALLICPISHHVRSFAATPIKHVFSLCEILQ